MNRLLAVAWKELIQLRRDRLTLGMMAALPVIQLLLFGWAINTDVRHMPTVVYDQDGSAASRDFARRLEATGFYDVVGRVRSYQEISLSFGIGGSQGSSSPAVVLGAAEDETIDMIAISLSLA